MGGCEKTPERTLEKCAEENGVTLYSPTKGIHLCRDLSGRGRTPDVGVPIDEEEGIGKRSRELKWVTTATNSKQHAEISVLHYL